MGIACGLVGRRLSGLRHIRCADREGVSGVSFARAPDCDGRAVGPDRYTVHFLDEDKLVGCRQEELQPVDAPWIPSRYEFRDKVAARIPLGIQGRVLLEQGEEGEVMKVVRDAPGGVFYHVHFSGRRTLQVPESALEQSG